MIKVNGIEGVCPLFNCDFIYVETDSQITSQTLDGDDLIIVGTNLPTLDVKVKLANSECGTVTASSTSITCTLITSASAGSWDVQVTDASGLIPVDTATAKIDVSLTISNIDPSLDLNQLGGDILLMTGTGFDVLTSNTVVSFSDGSTCEVTSSSPTQLECVVSGFVTDMIDSTTPYTATVSVNSVTDSTQSVSILSTKKSGLSVSPSSVSPVLSTIITV